MTLAQLWLLCSIGCGFPADLRTAPDLAVVTSAWTNEWGTQEVTLDNGHFLYLSGSHPTFRVGAPRSRVAIREGMSVLVWEAWDPFYRRRLVVLADPLEDDVFLEAQEDWVQDTVPHEQFARWLRPHSKHLMELYAAPCYHCREIAERAIAAMPPRQRAILQAYGKRERDPEVRWRSDRWQGTISPRGR